MDPNGSPGNSHIYEGKQSQEENQEGVAKRLRRNPGRGAVWIRRRVSREVGREKCPTKQRGRGRRGLKYVLSSSNQEGTGPFREEFCEAGTGRLWVKGEMRVRKRRQRGSAFKTPGSEGMTFPLWRKHVRQGFYSFCKKRSGRFEQIPM